MIFEKPLDYSREKVTEIVNDKLLIAFGVGYDRREKNLPRDLNTLLAYLAVYNTISQDELLYLQCAYQDLELHGFIKKC